MKRGKAKRRNSAHQLAPQPRKRNKSALTGETVDEEEEVPTAAAAARVEEQEEEDDNEELMEEENGLQSTYGESIYEDFDN